MRGRTLELFRGAPRVFPVLSGVPMSDERNWLLDDWNDAILKYCTNATCNT